MLPMIKKKRADVMNAVMDQSAIGAAAVPQADRKMPPTLAGAQRPVPKALPPMSAPVAPRQSFGGPAPGGQVPREPGQPVVQRGSDPIADRAGQRAAVGVAPGGTGFAPVTGAVGGGEGAGDFGSGTPKPFPTAPQQTPEQAAQSEQDKMDQEIRDFVRSRIGAAGKVDTTEEEALITRQMEGKLGEGLVDARARGGRAGFGMSGAQQAVEGDVRGAASRSALDQILGLRRGEEQRAIENATSAIGTEQGMRSAASADALRRMVLESLQAEAGLGGDEGGIPDAINGGVDAIAGAVGAETEKPALPSSGKGDQGMSSKNPIIVSAPPAGATLVNQNASFGGALYQGTDGKYYGVK
jgi:hypothetical protein